jgi:gamma-glutamylcyclotransferase (GGCT)/AIG2-like uncharacterized protein YtfP
MSQATDTLFVYGTLMSSALSGMRLISQAQARGHLFDLGSYPGLVLANDNAVVHGELYEATPEALLLLDRFERYDPSSLKESLYIRCQVRLIEPHVTAWVYIYNQSVTNCARIMGGEWLEHTAKESV